jgi:hypothetical protein
MAFDLGSSRSRRNPDPSAWHNSLIGPTRFGKGMQPGASLSAVVPGLLGVSLRRAA